MNLDWLLHGLPGWAVHLCLALLVGVESMGVPLPGETAVMAATLAARSPAADFGPVGIFLSCAAGAVVGDSLGYWVGRTKGTQLLQWITRRFPRHVTPAHLGWARGLMDRYGPAAVLGGRFVALLRMLAGPLAGSMGMHYPTFLLANAVGGITWSGATVAVLWFLGAAAESWLKGAAWVVLAVLAVLALLCGRAVNRAMRRDVERWAADHPAEMAQWEDQVGRQAAHRGRRVGA